MRQFFVVCLAVFAVLALLIPLGADAVWQGRYLLTVEVEGIERAESRKLMFSLGWTEEEVRYALRQGSEREVEFLPADLLEGNVFHVSVPCTGRTGFIGIEKAYREPLFLVVEFAIMADGSGQKRRKHFPIPAGRGARTMRITIP